MTSNFIYPLTLKAGDIKNDHTNDNRPNAAIGLVYYKKFERNISDNKIFTNTY